MTPGTKAHVRELEDEIERLTARIAGLRSRSDADAAEMERLRAENAELRKLRKTTTEHSSKAVRIFNCASCDEWEPRKSLHCGYCPIFAKLTTPEYGDQCTAWQEKP